MWLISIDFERDMPGGGAHLTSQSNAGNCEEQSLRTEIPLALSLASHRQRSYQTCNDEIVIGPYNHFADASSDEPKHNADEGKHIDGDNVVPQPARLRVHGFF